MLDAYKRFVEGSGLPDGIKDMMLTRTEDDLHYAFNDLAYMMEHCEFYQTLERIEKGQEWLAQQTDASMIEKGKAKIQKLLNDYERLIPQ